MQTSKTKNGSPEVPHKTSPITPKSSQKRRSIRSSELQSQATQLQEELKKMKEHLSSCESSRRQLQQEADESKKQLADKSAKLLESHLQLLVLNDRLQDFRRILQEHDKSWRSKLEALQKQCLADSAALLSAMNEIQRLKQQLNHMKSEAAQSTIENLEIHNNCIVSETQKQLEMANDTIETLHADSRNLLESLISVNSKLEQSKVRVGALEEIAAEYQGVVDDKEAERRNAHWNECGASELESIQIRSACEAAEFAKLRESELELTIERTRIELSELKERLLSKERESKELREEMEKGEDRRFDSELKLMKATTDVTELKADLLEKEAALQSILEENRILNSELSKRGHEHQIKYAAAIADAEKARAAEKEALTRTSLAEAKAANLEMEAELRRLKVQSDQWRKAAEAASAILAPGNNGSRIMEDSDGNSVSGRLTSSPSADDASPKKNSSILRKLGGLWKKSPKSFNYRKQAEEDEHVLQGFGNF